jgi:pyruvate/oxaloacetate carboxyltransferase
MDKNPLKITDVTLRDGHQSLLATRMRTEDMVPIAPDMNKAGF